MANNEEDHKNKCSYYTESRVGTEKTIGLVPRNKPQQQIYRPGSGPLRKSFGSERKETYIHTSGFDNRNSNTKVDNYSNSRTMDRDRKRLRKPEQQLYVAGRIEESNSILDIDNKCHKSGNEVPCNKYKYSDKSHRGGNDAPTNFEPNVNTKSKRFTNRHHANVESNEIYNRNMRQVSEPRGLPSHFERYSDSRSESSKQVCNENKGRSKLPSGKRNGTQSFWGEIHNRDKGRLLPNLPPRLQRKFLLDNGYSLDLLTIDKMNSNCQSKTTNNPSSNYNITNITQEINNMNCNDRIEANENHGIKCSTILPVSHGRGRGIVRRVGNSNNHLLHADSELKISAPVDNPVGGLKKLDQNVNSGYKMYKSISHKLICDEAQIKDNGDEKFTLDAPEMLEVDGTQSSNQLKRLDWSEEVELQDLANNKHSNPNKTDRQQKSRRYRRTNSKNMHRDRSRNRSSSCDSRDMSTHPSDAKMTNNNSHVNKYSHSDIVTNSTTHDSDPQIHNLPNLVDNIKSKVQHAPGLLFLPQNSSLNEPNHTSDINMCQHTLYDPSNPDRPIVVTQSMSNSNRKTVSSNVDGKQQSEVNELDSARSHHEISKPPWYDVQSTNFQSSRNPEFISCIEKLDHQLQLILRSGAVLNEWKNVQMIRSNLEQCLIALLTTDIKFCEVENVEHHFWKILFYNLIELLRKAMSVDSERKEKYYNALLTVIDDGILYYERLIVQLEQSYNYNLESYLGSNVMLPPKGLGFIGLALVASQKIFLFLGDLARYKEQVCETGNYSKSKQYYMKAQQVNPKNGRPYNQLAILSIYARRKLDAVYYYMRSLMSSNPFQSARDSLLSLFDENRKKYETAERKKKEALEIKRKSRIMAKSVTKPDSIRKEVWIHPKRSQRWNCIMMGVEENDNDSDSDEDLSQLSSIELNKKFIISYLHVHGKLITRIGMESFRSAARQMLKEFRLLLQRTPLPVNSHRLLQLVALNMFAIDATTSERVENGSPLRERAIGAALEMSSLLLERCIILISRQRDSPRLFVPADVHVILPAIKVWCDWLLCHISEWNPPPRSKDLRVGNLDDMWSRLAKLTGLLNKLNHKQAMLTTGPKEGHSIVRLQEDITFCGFTPLMYATPENVYAPDHVDPEAAQVALRLHKVKFFATEFLCGVDPPVLKSIARGDGSFEYISVLPIEEDEKEVVVHQFSDDDEKPCKPKPKIPIDMIPNISEETRELLRRREELLKWEQEEEEEERREQEMIEANMVYTEIEIRPKIVIADTNCFIDYLQELMNITKTKLFTLMVPSVVLRELEGLSRGIAGVRGEVAFQAIKALEILRVRQSFIKFVTTRGNVFNNANFTAEDIVWEGEFVKNDDRILTAAINLCKRDLSEEELKQEIYDVRMNKYRKLKRDVVLLTMDRNLRIKAMTEDVPVRDLPDFYKWVESHVSM